MTVSCATNYTLVGKSVLLCTSGLWSETVGTCEKGMKRIFNESSLPCISRGGPFREIVYVYVPD